MSEKTRIRIYKEDANSQVLEENISILVERKAANSYVELIKKTFPTTKIQQVNSGV